MGKQTSIKPSDIFWLIISGILIAIFSVTYPDIAVGLGYVTLEIFGFIQIILTFFILESKEAREEIATMEFKTMGIVDYLIIFVLISVSIRTFNNWLNSKL